MNLLLDTHVFLWWDREDKALKADTRTLIADAANHLFVSAASIWEIGIKRQLGKLEFRGAAAAAIGANGFHELPILPIDAEAASTLTWRYNDPFEFHAGRSGETADVYLGSGGCSHPRLPARRADLGGLTGIRFFPGTLCDTSPA